MLSQNNNDDIIGQIEDIVSEKVNQNDFATTQYVDDKIAEIPGGGEFDPTILEKYATKEYVDNASVIYDIGDKDIECRFNFTFNEPNSSSQFLTMECFESLIFHEVRIKFCIAAKPSAYYQISFQIDKNGNVITDGDFKDTDEYYYDDSTFTLTLKRHEISAGEKITKIESYEVYKLNTLSANQIANIYQKKPETGVFITNEYLQLYAYNKSEVDDKIAEIKPSDGIFDSTILNNYATVEYVDAKTTHTHEQINNELTVNGMLNVYNTNKFKASFIGGNNDFTRIRIGNTEADCGYFGFGINESKENYAYMRLNGTTNSEIRVHKDRAISHVPLTVEGNLNVIGNLNASNIYTKSQIDGKLNGYSDNKHTHEQINNDLTISGNLNVIGNLNAPNIYTKSQIDGKFAEIDYPTDIKANSLDSEGIETKCVVYKADNKRIQLYANDNGVLMAYSETKNTWQGIAFGSQTVTHRTNITGEIGTFCETNGGIYDGYDKIGETDCICQVIQSTTLNSKIVGIITSENEFASHGDVLVKVVPGTYKLGDILVPDITGKARVATETELQYMMLHAIPRPKITSLDTKIESTVACFIV